MHPPLEVDEQGLTRRHIAHHLEAAAVQGDALTGHHHIGALVGLRHPVDQRTNAMRVSKGQKAMACDQGHHRVGALDASVHTPYGLEDPIGCELHITRHALQFVGQDVDQHLGVALGVEVATVDVEQLALERRGIGQVPVMDQYDAVRGVDVEGLCLFFAVGIACGGVAHLTQPHVAAQGPHVAGAKHVANHAAGLVHEVLVTLHGDDARSILATVLQQQQGVINQLVDR